MHTTHSDQGLGPRAVLLAICVAAVPPAIGGTQRGAPDGLNAGPFALRPYFETGWERDDNVFRTDEESSRAPESDEINSVTVGLDAMLPFRNSLLGLVYEASQTRYSDHTFSRDTDEEIGLDLALNLNDKDGIAIRERHYTGFTDIGRIENSEVVFDGEGFTQNRIDLEFFRGVNREKGYSIRLTHVDHAFNEIEGDEDTRSFFNYKGLDGAVEYRQPLPSYKWLVAYYGFRRFDHFEEDRDVKGNPLVLFRQERSETAQIGVRGLLGKDQPIVLRIGWGRFRYDFPDASSAESEFTGLAAHLDWELKVGGGSELALNLDRRALPSSSDTYYVNSEFGAAFSRDILRDSSFGVDFEIGRNKYGEAIDCGGPTADQQQARDDKNYRIRANVDLRPHERLSYYIAASYRIRNSNCLQIGGPPSARVVVGPLFDFTATEVAIGISMGWF